MAPLHGKPLKLVEQVMYLGRNLSSTEINVNIGKVWTATDRLMTIWKSDLPDEIKW